MELRRRRFAEPAGKPQQFLFGKTLSEIEQSRSLIGTRTSKQGRTYTANLAVQALLNFGTGENRPIFSKFGNDITMGSELPGKYYSGVIEYDDGTYSYSKELDPGTATQYLKVDQNLVNGARLPDNDDDKPLVFLVTSKVHATIYIIKAGQIYTCGYGFLSDGEEYSQKMIRDVAYKVSPGAASYMTKKAGAIYTADYYSPKEEHESKIAWVGFLNSDMVDRIQEFLNSAIEIDLELTLEKDDEDPNSSESWFVSNVAKIKLSKTYKGSVGFIDDNESFNCLLWAQKVLNININCGFLGNPADCQPISPAQFKSLTESYAADRNAFVNIVREIQRSLEAPSNLCTRIARTLGRCIGYSGGKTRKNKRKNKRRSQRRNKSRRNKSRR